MASIKIKDFFNGRFFEIPKYQRGYAWEVQNIRDLFDDIIESIVSVLGSTSCQRPRHAVASLEISIYDEAGI